MAQVDPRFLLQNPAFASQENAADVQYGYVVDPTTGVRREATAAENPYSPLVAMRQQMMRDNASMGARAAASGTLFSGGTLSTAQGLAQGLEKNIFGNQSAHDAARFAATQSRNQLISDIVGGYLADPDRYAQPTPAAATPPPAQLPATPGAKPAPKPAAKPKPKPKAPPTAWGAIRRAYS
jgi:hypothetical protein